MESKETSPDTEVADKIIYCYGRINPHLYAFTTTDVPNAIKIGDTYRSTELRLSEWSNKYHNVDNLPQYNFSTIIRNENGRDVYFRDYEVHEYLTQHGTHNLNDNDFNRGIYHSREFFRYNISSDELISNVRDAVNEIKRDYAIGAHNHNFYYVHEVNGDVAQHYERETTQSIDLRENQRTVVENFKNAVDNGRTNLLMYATMRFGKTFTALMCAKEKGYKFVVIVSAKADVKDEWKRTSEKYIQFADYTFYDGGMLLRNDDEGNQYKDDLIQRLNNKEKVILFETLQDLYTKDEGFKERHRQIFDEHMIDLLIVDETHFGARGEKYGEVIKSNDSENADYEDTLEADKKIQELKDNNTLNYNIKLHLSGTPYRILMGDEFGKEDIICTCTYDDISEARDQWYIDNPEKDEWENPYYGFPKMIRFAFNPSESVMSLLNQYRDQGYSYGLSELFKTKSLRKTETNEYHHFIHEKEVLDLFLSIDGGKRNNKILGFLNYKSIKDTNMCQHIVCALPYKASCDALACLLNDKKDKFKNISDYEIINISGFDARDKKVEKIKAKISNFAKQGKKTLTLTVNKMLTGCTIPEWDTMIYLKDTTSAQEYDQAIYRLQNQYIENCETEGGTIKIDKKPLTLLVDFSPKRMFMIEEQKARVCDFYCSSDENRKNDVIDYINERAIKTSPIIRINKNRLIEVNGNNIMTEISDYHNNRGIREEVEDIAVDLKMCSNTTIKNAISRENELGSKKGISVPANTSDNKNNENDIENSNNENENLVNNQNIANNDSNNANDENKLANQIRSYYVRVLLYSFLTNSEIKTVDEIIDQINDDNDDAKRIANNIGIYVNELKAMSDYLKYHNIGILCDLNERIRRLNKLSTDGDPNGVEIAISKFGKLGPAVVYTQPNVAENMVKLIPNEELKKISEENPILDIASTCGEFAVAIKKRMISLDMSDDAISNSIYSIPKDSICYELIRKVYEFEGLNVKNIATFTTNDIVGMIGRKKSKKSTDSVYNEIMGKICDSTVSFDEIKLTSKKEKKNKK